MFDLGERFRSSGAGQPVKLALISRHLPPDGGGVAVSTENTAQALAALGHEIHLFTEARPSPYRTAVENGVRVHRLPRSPRWWAKVGDVRHAVHVDRALRRAGPFDIVHAWEWDAEAAVFALRRGNSLVTQLATPHYLVAALNRTPRWRVCAQSLIGRLERLQARRSALVISPSTALAEIVRRDWGLDPDRMAVVPTGVRRELLRDGEAGPSVQLPKPYVLYFGRLEVRKGVQDWIRALPAVLAQNPELTAVFVGSDEGIEGSSFVDYAHRICASVWHQLRFVPQLPQRELLPVVAGAKLVVLPSRWENLSNACLEAMALGRPVLATSGSAFDELILDGVSGFLAEPENPEALGRLAAKVLSDPGLLASVGEGARRRAGHFALGETTARLVRTYSELLSRRG